MTMFFNSGYPLDIQRYRDNVTWISIGYMLDIHCLLILENLCYNISIGYTLDISGVKKLQFFHFHI